MRRHSLFAFVLAVPVLPGQVTVQVPAVQDTTLYEDPQGSIGNGQGFYLFAGRNSQGSIRRALVAFDLASVPVHSHILDVSLTLEVSRFQGTGAIEVSVHRVRADWGEGPSMAGGGEGGGGPAMLGDATWLHRRVGGNSWSMPGGDFDSNPLASAAMPAAGPVSWNATLSLRGVVQSWLDEPAVNFGLLAKTNEFAAGEVVRFDSLQNANLATRPFLTVTYLPAGNAMPRGVGCLGSNGRTMRLHATRPPLLGTPDFDLVLSDGPAFGYCGHILSTALALEPWAPVPSCFVYLAPYHSAWPVMAVGFLDGGGGLVMRYSIPPNPALRGTPVAIQSFAQDQGLPFGVVFSNALMVVLQ